MPTTILADRATVAPATYSNASGRHQLRELPRFVCEAYRCTEPATHELVGGEISPKMHFRLCKTHGLERLGALL